MASVTIKSRWIHNVRGETETVYATDDFGVMFASGVYIRYARLFADYRRA